MLSPFQEGYYTSNQYMTKLNVAFLMGTTVGNCCM